MNGISGELELKFRVRDAADVERIMAFYREFEGVPVVRQPRSARAAKPRHRITKGESQDRIIKLLKEAYPVEGFARSDAVAEVLEKLDLRAHTTGQAIARAIKEGVLVRRRKLYFWTEIIQKQIEDKLKHESEKQEPPAPVNDQPIAELPA